MSTIPHSRAQSKAEYIWAGIIAIYLIVVFIIAFIFLAGCWHCLSLTGGGSVPFEVIVSAGLIGSMVISCGHLSVHIGVRTFRVQWALWYFVQPLIGGGMALIAYWGMEGGILATNAPQGFKLFLCSLFAMFSSDATRRLRTWFGNYEFAAKPPEAKDGAAANSTTGDFNSLSTDKQKDILEKYVAANQSDMKRQYPNVEHIEVGFKRKDSKPTGQRAIVFFVINKGAVSNTGTLPATITIKDGDTKYNVPTDVRNATLAVSLAYNTCEGQLVKNPGCSVGTPTSDESGSIGFIATKYYDSDPSHDEKVMVSCYHVIAPAKTLRKDWAYSNYDNKSDNLVQSPSRKDTTGHSNIIGCMIEGCITTYLDIALVRLYNNQSVVNKVKMPDGGSLTCSTYCSSKDINKSKAVFMMGRTSGFVSATVSNPVVDDVVVKYSENIRNAFDDLIEITADGSATFAGGDSGALIYDTQGKAVGILTCGYENEPHKAYIVKIESILNLLNLILL